MPKSHKLFYQVVSVLSDLVGIVASLPEWLFLLIEPESSSGMFRSSESSHGPTLFEEIFS